MQCARKAATVPNLRLEVQEKLKQDDEHMLENGDGNGVKSLKIRAPGVVWSSWATLLAPRWPKMRFWTRLGLYLEVSWGASWHQDGAVAAKMALSCPTWRQDGPKMAILDFKMTNLRPVWEASCLLFGIFGAKSQIAKNIEKQHVFQGFWRSWGCSWRSCWLILARCWAMLGQLGAILEQLGDKMRPKSAKMSQDSARWRTRAPRRGKIGELSGPGGSQTGSTPWGGW